MATKHNHVLKGLTLNPELNDCLFRPNRRNSRGWTQISRYFCLTLRVNNHR
jgi:hypothetical protein